jgi:TPR repeat protein
MLARALQFYRCTDARAWFEAAADQGFAEGQVHLGVLLQLGQTGEQDYEAARCWYEKAAMQGSAEGQFRLGQLYREVFNNPAQAERWLAAAAEQGNALAQNALGVLYARQRRNQARHWFQAAANQGLKEALDNLALL